LNFFKTKYVNKQQKGIIKKNKISSSGKFISRIPKLYFGLKPQTPKYVKYISHKINGIAEVNRARDRGKK